MQRIKLEMTKEAADLVIQSLAKLPYEMVADLIMDLRTQGIRQLREMEDAAKESATKNEIPDEKTRCDEAPTERPEDAVPTEGQEIGG